MENVKQRGSQNENEDDDENHRMNKRMNNADHRMEIANENQERE